MDCPCKASLSITNLWSLLRLMSIELVMPSKHLIPCHPFLLLSSVFPNIRVFSNEWTLSIRWPKYWSFSISPSNEYSGLISFRIDWFDLFAVQRTFRSLLQHHSSKHQFFHAQPSLWSNTHIHTWLLKKPQLWLLQTFVGKMISLLLICYLGLKAGGDWRQEEKGTTENEMTKWHYQLNGHDFEQAPGVGQGRLACYSPWGGLVRYNWTTQRNNWEVVPADCPWESCISICYSHINVTLCDVQDIMAQAIEGKLEWDEVSVHL